MNPSERPPFWIVGSGRMGLAIADLLEESKSAGELRVFGRRAAAPSHRLFQARKVSYQSAWTEPPSSGAVVILAVPDDAIAVVAESLAGSGPPAPGAVALHLSGARPSQLLAPLARIGYAVGALHPLQTVASRDEGGGKLRGAYFAFEGEPRAREAALLVVRAASGSLLEIDAGSKGLYHAACVFAANYVVTNAAVAARMLGQAAGIGVSEALRALLPLIRGAVGSLDAVGLPAALTGPIKRGDLETVRLHLQALDGPTRSLYSVLARETLKLARAAGLDAARARAIEDLLDAQP